MILVFQIVVGDDHWGSDQEVLQDLISKHESVVSVAPMVYDGMGGYDVIDEGRIQGPRSGYAERQS